MNIYTKVNSIFITLNKKSPKRWGIVHRCSVVSAVEQLVAGSLISHSKRATDFLKFFDLLLDKVAGRQKYPSGEAICQQQMLSAERLLQHHPRFGADVEEGSYSSP